MKLSISHRMDTVVSPFYLPPSFYRSPAVSEAATPARRLWDTASAVSFFALVWGVGGFALAALFAFPV